MSTNDQELAIVVRQLAELREQRAQLSRQAMESPFRQRIELAGLEKMIARLEEEVENLLETLPPEPEEVSDEELLTELQRRSADFDQGRAGAISWSELKKF